MDLPRQLVFPDGLSSSAPPIDRAYRLLLKELRDEHADALTFLGGIVLREIWFAAHAGSHYMKLRRLCHPAEPRVGADEWTPTLYAEMDGWAYMLFSETAHVVTPPAREHFLRGTPFKPPVQDLDLLGAAGLFWFWQSDRMCSLRDTSSAMVWLHEAHEALSLRNGIGMWKEGFDAGQTEASQAARADAHTLLSRRAAEARHKENRAMKQQVFAWCDEHMEAAPSMDAAAGLVAGILVPVSWRTVREWMTEWRKLRSPGRA